LAVVGEGTGGMPILSPTGAYAKSSADSTDAFIARFDSADQLTWSTYYGGNDIEQARGVAIDLNNDIYITGHAQTLFWPAYYTGAAYVDSIRSGSDDAFMLKFSSGGVRLWSTLFGGQYTESGTSVAVDSYNDVYF